ncbi:ABC transporter permease [Tianweitania sp. BSSL-BM11]|uniref:ABC transporter permease n=1 Tax=Tianweitania aestuarii TaxID=2814886 RepID=A0ABS5RRL7_9HYPH|nr:ABC transporter permease [Tianweitania aestuarii]MBS9719695.1 ABC transporter permease [Tianweitania aestuarii]
MFAYVTKRLIAMPFLLLGVITVAFLLTHFTAADPLTSIIGERQMNNPEVVEAARQRWGLDRSLPEQYLVYLGNLVTGDFGTSFRTRQPVAQDLILRLPATLELVIAAMMLGTLFGITLGVLAARFRGGVIDNLARLFALIGASAPVFWSGLLVLFVFSVQLGWLPGPGRIDARAVAPPFVTGFFTIDTLLAGDWTGFRSVLLHLLLPASVLGWTVTGIVSRMVRASMLDVLSQEYILAARAKGASPVRVLLHHALRNAMLPTLTIIGFSFAYLITGAVLTETIFAWPGIGSYAVSAARGLDHPAIVGVTIIGGAAFLIANLLTDIAYAVVDPRVKLGAKAGA